LLLQGGHRCLQSRDLLTTPTVDALQFPILQALLLVDALEEFNILDEVGRRLLFLMEVDG
jgi:hypothetical protein